MTPVCEVIFLKSDHLEWSYGTKGFENGQMALGFTF